MSQKSSNLPKATEPVLGRPRYETVKLPGLIP